MIDPNEVICGGVVHDEILKGYEEEIQSKDIISFSYQHPDYKVTCQKEEDHLHITSCGGSSNERDGTHFKLEYDTKDFDILKELQRIVEEYSLNLKNGSYEEVAGLPSGLGDTILIEYESGEKIYHSSNRCLNLEVEPIYEIYEAFHTLAIKNGFDFTTEKSNQIIYDDAEEDFLQGTWKGTHFGDEIVVTFSNNQIKIFVNGKETDSGEYIIYEGCIKKNQLKEGKTGTSEHDYENFKGVSCLRKKNNILLVAYFLENSYSTCDLLIQK